LISAWALSSALAVFSFFYGFRTQGLGFHALIDAPLHHLLYILAYLGSPLVPDSLQGAIVAGGLGLGLLGWLAWVHIQHYATAVHTLLPLLSIALFAAGSAAMTAVGRNHLPLEQALESRYITISQLLWIANITMVCLTLSAQQKLRPGRSLGKAASIGFLLLVQLCIASNHLTGMDTARVKSRIFNRAARAIVASYPNVDVRDVKRLTPRTSIAIEVLPIVYENKLSLFRAPLSSD
jgi:hypothetical protein